MDYIIFACLYAVLCLGIGISLEKLTTIETLLRSLKRLLVKKGF